MNIWQNFFKERCLILPIRLYHAMSAIITLAVVCIFSGVFTHILCRMSKINLSHDEVLMLCSVLTVCLGGPALAWEAKFYIRPAEDVVNAARKVMDRDFTVQIPKSELRINTKEGEMLTDCFNRMVRELNGMEKMQRDFISSVSHEFKTPLSSIAGFAEILLDGGISPEEQQEYLNLMYHETMRLSRLSENLLRLSRLDAQEIVTHREKVAVDEQIRRTLILLTERLESRETTLDISLPEIIIESDPDMLAQIWLNLIDNAIKYSPAGKTLHITGEILAGAVSVHIRDEGYGIPAGKIPHIFERFYQCEESHKSQGAGLGLSIVGRIGEILGGSIECRSRVGVGTEMIVTLPRN